MMILNKKLVMACMVSACFVTTGVQAGAGEGTKGQEHTHDPKPDVSIAATKVAGSVSMIMGVNGFAGGNVAVSTGPDGQLIIDTLLSGFEQKLEGALEKLSGCSGCSDLKYLINTHWHFDHVGNNDHFGGAPVLIAHETVRPLLETAQELKSMGLKMEPKTRAGLPDVTFDRHSSVYFNDEEIKLTHFPASHTTGDIVAYFTDANVLHVGDLYFNGMFPFIDVEHGGRIKGVIHSVESILENYPDDVKIIPGHGGLSGKKEMREYLDMLKATTKVVEDAKAKGLPLEDIQNIGLSKKWSKWAWAFVTPEAWIAMIYHSL